jgi:hypothetical protein
MIQQHNLMPQGRVFFFSHQQIPRMGVAVYEPMLEDHISKYRDEIFGHFFWIDTVIDYLLSIVDFAASDELHHYQPFRR